MTTSPISPFELAARIFEPAPPSPYIKDPAGWVRDRLGEFLWSKQREVAASVVTHRKTAVRSCHNAGKGLPLDTKLPTPTGWTTMGEVQPGDMLLDEQGQPCKVEAITPTWNEPCYAVRFSNGEEVVTDAGHLWSTVRLRERHALRQRLRGQGKAAPVDWREHWGLARTFSTPEIAASLRTGLGQLVHAVPACAPLELVDVDLPVAPYVLGAWLGDGTSVAPEITCAVEDREIVDRIASLGENVRKRDSSKFAWTMAGPLSDRPILRHRLQDLGVLGNKHIPMRYLRASREQRLELLRGIMDTDGFNGNNSVGVDFCSERLANDLAELVRSLGCVVNVRKCRATCNGVDAGFRYRLNWRSPFVPFHLERKRAAWHPDNNSRRTVRTITSVEATESVPTRCIQVSSRSELYLATEHFIPTHNSRIASRIAAWFVDVFADEDPFVVSTAPTYAQVHGILWEEIRNAAKKAAANGNPLPGRVLGSDQWKLADGTLAGWGRKPADTDQHGFQGVHHRHMLVIIDEACGVPRQLWTAVEAITTGENVSILALGNPDDPNTEFGDVCKPGSGWNVIGISAFDTPNLTGEVIPDELRPVMLDPAWVEDKKRWGVESPRYVSKVLGEFPDIGTDTLISPALIEAAQQRALVAEGRGILGVDVARYGMDRTVIYLRRGPVVRLVGEHSKLATTETTGQVIAAQRATGADEIRVDGVGVGAGVVDQLSEQGFGVLDMQAGAAARDRERFLNARAEWAWGLRTRLEDGDLDLDPADDELAAQLGSIKYRYNSRGQVVIESKDDMRKRGLPSPDRADAAILTSATTAGADLFARLRWRMWAPGQPGRVELAGRSWALAETWTCMSAHLPSADGDDAVTALVWALTVDGDLVVLDYARQRVGDRSPFDLIRGLTAGRRVDTVFVDRRQFPQVQRAGQVAGGVHVTPLNVDPDRLARALPASARQAAGKVWLPATAVWREPFAAECLAFPNGRTDGAVMALSLAVSAADTQWRPPLQSAAMAEAKPYREREIDFLNIPM